MSLLADGVKPSVLDGRHHGRTATGRRQSTPKPYRFWSIWGVKLYLCNLLVKYRQAISNLTYKNKNALKYRLRGTDITYLFWVCLQTWDFLCGISPKETVLALSPHDRG